MKTAYDNFQKHFPYFHMFSHMAYKINLIAYTKNII